MWKKDEMSSDIPTAQSQPRPHPQAQPQPQQERAPERPVLTASAPSERAVIGRSITLRGDVTGDEDLMIQGRVEGSVNLQQHSVTVGPNGEVSASIVGRIVTIEGRVEGNIDGGEQVILRSSAFVQGDITAPRVALEDGARFRGLVDMGDVEEPALRKVAAAAPEPRRESENEKASSKDSTASNGVADNGKTSSESTTASREETGTRGSSASGKDSGGGGGGTTGKGKRPNESEAQITI